jgi:hypothetical protein
MVCTFKTVLMSVVFEFNFSLFAILFFVCVCDLTIFSARTLSIFN